MIKRVKPEPETLKKPDKISIPYCPYCGCNNLKRESEQEDDTTTIYKTVCLDCGWSGDVLEVIDLK